MKCKRKNKKSLSVWDVVIIKENECNRHLLRLEIIEELNEKTVQYVLQNSEILKGI